MSAKTRRPDGALRARAEALCKLLNERAPDPRTVLQKYRALRALAGSVHACQEILEMEDSSRRKGRESYWQVLQRLLPQREGAPAA